MTPTDDYAFVGDPPMMRPKADEVHVSCSFTWDVPRAKTLALAWGQYYPVKLGGPAFNTPADGFTCGCYLKTGVVITHRGCPNRCPWCLVKREGDFRLLPIQDGYINQDNNFAACPREHRMAYYRMAERQSRAQEFRGGIEAARVTSELADEFRAIRIHFVFLACDTEGGRDSLAVAIDRLSFLGRNKLYCYALIGFKGTSFWDMLRDARRLEYVWNTGAVPFAQLYQPANKRIIYPQSWRELARNWSRPAIIKARASQRGTVGTGGRNQATLLMGATE